MRKSLAFAAVVSFAGAGQAAPASQESVENLLELTKTESMMDSMYGTMQQTMRQAMQQSLQGKKLGPEQQRVLDLLPAKFIAAVREEMNWNKLKPLYVRLYIDTFEQEEVDGLIAFYKSPAGQAFVSKMPLLVQKSMALTQSQMQSLFPRMKTAIEEAIDEAKITR